MSRKKKKQEKQERLAIKDFFDRILPGVLKFYSDHYICGDSYRCVWAIKEYPPSTEECGTAPDHSKRQPAQPASLRRG